MGAHAFNPSTLEAKFSEILNKKRKKKKKSGMVILHVYINTHAGKIHSPGYVGT